MEADDAAPVRPFMPLAAGQVIDGFRLDERTHQGSMASVWRVWRVSRVAADADAADPPLIMKVPRLSGIDDPTSIVGFEVEQMILPTLAGRHVPRFIAKGDFTRQPYIVMERIAGHSLKARLDVAPIPVDEVAELGRKVAIALHDLHRQNVIHLDVKPSNVMLRETGEAVLLDFGLSRHAHLPDLLEEEFALPMGTGPYISPEQVRQVRDDPRSDLFALGVMMYALCTGVRPFGNPDSVRGLRRRLYREPTPPRVLRQDCPPWLQEIILRCLEVQPERRHQSAAQLALDLQHPEQVSLTSRALRPAQSGRLRTMHRWLSSIGTEAPARPNVLRSGAGGRIVLAAVDVAAAEPALLDAVRDAVLRVMLAEPGARLACVAILATHWIAMDAPLDDGSGNRHVHLLVELKHWARPVLQSLALKKDEHDARVTFHVLAAPDPAAAIVDYARRIQVDHIVMGARSSSALRRYLGSVSSQVVAQAHCTVTVVRSPTAD